MCSVSKTCTGVFSALALAFLLLGTIPAAAQLDLSAEAPAHEGGLAPNVACAAGPYPLCGGDCPPLQGCVPNPGGPVCDCHPETPPCSECPPGPHFMHAPGCGPFPPIGPDLIANNGAVVGIDVDMDCVRDFNLVMGPCPPPNDLLRVDKRQGPMDDSVQFPGFRPIDAHQDVIDTEIVAMCLTGSGVTMAAGNGGPASFPIGPSLGAIGEDPGDPTLADSFFDVFFELQGPPGSPWYNKTPIVVQTKIDCLPPRANYHHPVGLCLPLWTRGVCAGGPNAGNQCVRDVHCPGSFCANQQHMANLVSANHSVNEPVCNPQSTNCNGNCPAGDQCQPGPAGCECLPVPCEAGSPPQCNGTCPPGMFCDSTAAADPCHCEPIPCEQAPWPQCGGPCPPGLICQPDSSGIDLCRCEPPPCDQSPFPTCNGFCPGGLVCAPNALGTCECGGGPLPCDQTAPACDGQCPSGLVCTGDAAGCHCDPPPCDQSPFPQCGGTCPPGLICVQDSTGLAACRCEPPPCDQTFPPSCGGTCPPGLACVAGVAGAPCSCEPIPCDQTLPPTCGGDCPPGLICQVDATGKCNCVQPPCEQSAPACNGPCPPGLVCVSDPTQGCACAPAPCDQSPAPQCGGTCPAGEVCAQVAGSNFCDCVPVPCQQGAYPQCNGPCPAPLVCAGLPGATQCDCVLPACDQSAPMCNGTCPTPGDVCVADAVGCHCQPPPCDQSAPACNGLCPNGEICTPNAVGCACAPVPCEQSAWPQCGGPCPPGEICIAGTNGACFCEPQPCGPTGPHQCGGTCPPNQICQTTPTDGCECAPVSCQQSPYPQCGGPCPPGQYCHAPLLGNSCLCCPGLPVDPVDGVLWTSKKIIIWNPHPLPCGYWYNLYKYTGTRMQDADNDGVSEDYGSPAQCNLPDATATEPGGPPVGAVEFFQVTVEGPGGEGPMGVASNGLPRPNVTPCP